MESSWRHLSLGDVTRRITKGTTPTTGGGSFSNRGVAFIKAESITSDGRIDRAKLAHIDVATDARLSRSRLERDDILFSIAGTIGRVALVDDAALPGNTNQAVAIIRPDKNIVEPRFLYYALRDEANIREAHTKVVQSVQANFSLGELSLLKFPVPSLLEQRAIASVLGALDDKIELNRKMSATLETMARVLFKSWFVDFDPVRANAKGRDTSLPAEIAALFPDSLENSELGEIPKGWAVESIGEIANINRAAINPTDFPDEIFAHYSIPAFDAGRLPISETADSIKSNKFLVSFDAVLLSRLNPKTPRVWIPHLHGLRRAICSTEFAVMSPTMGSREWLYCLLSSDSFCERFTTMVTGTSGSHQRVKPESLLAMRIIAPAKAVMKAFTAAAAPLLSRVAHSRDESATLASVRDALLPRLISGEIRVFDAEHAVEKSA